MPAAPSPADWSCAVPAPTACTQRRFGASGGDVVGEVDGEHDLGAGQRGEGLRARCRRPVPQGVGVGAGAPRAVRRSWGSS